MPRHATVRTALALGGCVVALLAPPVPPAAASAGAALGVVADVTWGLTRGEVDRTVASLQDAGVRWARVALSWNSGEPEKGSLNEPWLVEVDYAVAKMRHAGIQVVMPIDGVPFWASADPAKHNDATGQHWDRYWRPASWQDFADFVRLMVKRYSALDVQAYEIWNEPNHSFFWPHGVDAAGYAEVLARAYRAVKQADADALVVMGGLSMNDWGYLEALYAAGAGGSFDVAAVHPYTGRVDPDWCWPQAGSTRNAREAFCGIEEVRRTMVAHGDAGKPIWLTEFGWSSSTGEWGVTAAEQADYLVKALAKLESYPYVRMALWYAFRNLYWLRDAPDSLEANYGLLRSDFRPKPAYAVVKAYNNRAWFLEGGQLS